MKKNKQGDKKVTAKKTAAKKSAVLEQSTKPELIFGNFAGNMCSSWKAIDPRVMLGDLLNDQIRYSAESIELLNSMIKNVKPRFKNTGESSMQLRYIFIEVWILFAKIYRQFGQII